MYHKTAVYSSSYFSFQAYTSYYLHQFERGEALDNITKDVKKALEAECDEESLKVLSKTVDAVRKEVSVLI